MFSFAKIATFATLAFSALASAMPQPPAAPEARELAARQAEGITTILTNLNEALVAPVDQLNVLIVATTTAEAVQPLVNNIQEMLRAAYNDCQGKPAGPGNLLILISVTITFILNAFARVYDLPGVDQVSLAATFQLIDVVLAALVNIVLGTLGGLLPLLQTQLFFFISTVVSFTYEFGFLACISALGL